MNNAVVRIKEASSRYLDRVESIIGVPKMLRDRAPHVEMRGIVPRMALVTGNISLILNHGVGKC
jgi:sorbitol-specific phosphotransferase system component IIBC